MKTPFYLWLSLCCNFIVKAQENAGFTKSDTRAQYIPSAETHSTASIAKYIIGNYTTEREKLLAAYSWVTYNIKYNSDSMYVINFNPDPQTRITAALRRRKGVCENFAAIFNDIAVKAGIQSYEVTGYTKQYGSIDKTAHTWCAVYLEGKWFFCDPTWDVGFSGYAKYFLVPPSAFIESHMPFDPLWQLLDQPVSHKEFYQGYIRSKKDKTLINFVDSINAFTQMNESQQLESAAHRINQAGVVNELVRTRLVWIQMQISIIYQDTYMNMYNAAVTDLNNINVIFNDFVEFRNNRFLPQKPDMEIKAMLTPIDSLLSAAYQKLEELDESPANFQYNSSLLRNRLATLSNRIAEQKVFLKRYLASALPERNQLFYEPVH